MNPEFLQIKFPLILEWKEIKGGRENTNTNKNNQRTKKQ